MMTIEIVVCPFINGYFGMTNDEFLDLHPDYLYSTYSCIGNYNKEYFAEIHNYYKYVNVIVKDSCFCCINYKNNYYNIINGVRKTTDSPKKFDHRIFLLGSSYAFGARVEDKYTISSYLQRQCNEFYKDPVCVQNLGVLGAMIQNSWLQCRYLLPKMELSSGDTVVIILHKNDIMRDYTRYALSLYNYFTEMHINFLLLMWPRMDEFISPSPLERSLSMYSYNELYDYQYKNSCLPHQREYSSCPKSIDKYWIELLSSDWCYDLQSEFERPHDYGEIFIDKLHTGPKGNRIVANFIFQKLLYNTNLNENNKIICSYCDDEHNYEVLDTESIKWLQRTFRLFGRVGCNQTIIPWLKTIPRFDKSLVKESKVGCIVMNCNPMTLGHVYCIHKSLEIVDYLYVFIVNEDKSVFPFHDRFNMVKTVCAKEFKDRVRVIPSGEFIISSFSFPGYFTKEAKQISVADRDSSFDVVIFGSLIARALGITHRFVGEEPLCPITRDYNQIMLKLLPPMGVKVHVFPRKQSGEDPISASRVRGLLQSNDWDSIRDLVPKEIYKYLLKCKRSKEEQKTIQSISNLLCKITNLFSRFWLK